VIPPLCLELANDLLKMQLMVDCPMSAFQGKMMMAAYGALPNQS
jgi:hypothetical protein